MSRVIRILHFSPGTATPRHDSHRAGLGIVRFLQEAVAEQGVSLGVEWIWALPAIGSREQVHSLLEGGDVLVVVTPTYGQGSPWFVRKFFELSGGCALWGKPATAMATAGGHHTGGEVAVADTLRSLQGLGACTFSFAQKTLVLGTQQKVARDGEFDRIDGWFMRQFARLLMLQAILRDEPDAGSEWAARLGLRSDYYQAFPTEPELDVLLGGLVDRLNLPLIDPELGYAQLSEAVGFPCPPPDAASLRFADLLPHPLPESVTLP